VTQAAARGFYFFKPLGAVINASGAVPKTSVIPCAKNCRSSSGVRQEPRREVAGAALGFAFFGFLISFF